MQDEPLIAVVVVHFGSPEMTRECLKSIYACNYMNLRVIVIDNCPEQRLLSFFPEVEASAAYILNSTNTGYCGGNNLGIMKAQELGAKYILLLNNDTIVDTALLSICVIHMESQPDISVISPKILFHTPRQYINVAGGQLDFNTGDIEIFGLNEKDVGQYDSEKEITFATGCAFFARASVFDQVGLFDEELFCYGEDVDMSRRIVLAGLRMKYLPIASVWHKHPMAEYLGYRKKGQFGAMSGMYYMWRNKYYNQKKYASKNRLAEAARFGYRFVWVLAAYALKHKRPDLSLAMLFGLFDAIAGRMGKRDYWFLNVPRSVTDK